MTGCVLLLPGNGSSPAAVTGTAKAGPHGRSVVGVEVHGVLKYEMEREGV